jgi:hypothetical protein
MPLQARLANYCHYLERLLLSVEQLSDPHWEPDTSIDVFLQARVRPAVYFLQRCAVGKAPGNTANHLILEGTYVSYIPPKMRRKHLPWQAPFGLFHPLYQVPVLEPKPNFSTFSIGFGGPVKLSVKFVTR